MEISLERWKEANKGELKSWSVVLGTIERALIEDMYHAHSPILFSDGGSIENQSVCDIGGGPISILLHFNTVNSVVVDPLDVPSIFKDNYNQRGITLIQEMAESFLENYDGVRFDCVTVYNCLQHVQKPDFILENLWKVAPVLRISEPCNYPVNELHPHMFTPEGLWEKLDSISISGKRARVDYDFPYVGGVYNLRSF